VNLLQSLRGQPQSESRSWLNDPSAFFFQGQQYQLGLNQTLNSSIEKVDSSFEGYVQGALKRNGIVFTCIAVRMLVFSEARFQFRRYENGRPQDLFGGRQLSLLERPWSGGTTGDLLSRMELHASLAGNAFVARRDGRLKMLRPDWTTIVRGSDDADAESIDADLVGYIYKPGGPSSQSKPVFLPADEVAHYAPYPDPEVEYRGMSWLTPVLREVMADGAFADHQLKFFENGATPNMVVKVDPTVKLEAFKEFREDFLNQHQGLMNAYKTLFLGGGADASVVGANFDQMDFRQVRGSGETRIAAASGVGAIIGQFSEGMQGSSLNAGNYATARRRFADMTIRPLWRNAAASLETILDVPSGAHLWYDDRDIPALREDADQAANIQSKHVTQIVALVRDGFTPESAVTAVQAGDMNLLVHSGNLSVQLQPSDPANQTDLSEGVADD
jgi:phage portal protein BeeE